MEEGMRNAACSGIRKNTEKQCGFPNFRNRMAYSEVHDKQIEISQAIRFYDAAEHLVGLSIIQHGPS